MDVLGIILIKLVGVGVGLYVGELLGAPMGEDVGV